jgi:hypothetical protein
MAPPTRVPQASARQEPYIYHEKQKDASLTRSQQHSAHQDPYMLHEKQEYMAPPTRAHQTSARQEPYVYHEKSMAPPEEESHESNAWVQQVSAQQDPYMHQEKQKHMTYTPKTKALRGAYLREVRRAEGGVLGGSNKTHDQSRV